MLIILIGALFISLYGGDFMDIFFIYIISFISAILAFVLLGKAQERYEKIQDEERKRHEKEGDDD